ncbi:MAG TPA: M10 family metallopeptidase C-terminal domain-containing protein, partial [Allosphingosinicella sp.]|nr:M10 family metallopeptidase C-terminal domain-containing protein [Allosphingosinicella sp.]
TLSSASDHRYARGGGSKFAYDITWADSLLGAGQSFTVSGALLRGDETMIFDGSAETDGSFRIFAGAGADTLYGGSGNDLIAGGLGGDVLYGRGGNDVFRLDSAADSTPAGKDWIGDFTAGDRIDLSRIDSDTLQAGNQAFGFIGKAGFGHQAGELRIEQMDGPIWLVQGDRDGDGLSDFELVVALADSHSLSGADFIL